MSLAISHDAMDAPLTLEAAMDEAITLATRFGALTFTAEQAIAMPSGMVGFPEQKRFGLATPPVEGYESFAVLQCLDDADLGFITLPIAKEGGLIAEKDLRGACAALGVAWDDAAILLVCTIRPGANGAASLSVNLQAPVIIDAAARKAWQHVLTGGGYSVRHALI